MKLTILQVGQNTKLGKNVATWSRPVGPSCPHTCPFLHTACYAERMQNFRPNVKASWARQGGHREAEYWRDWAKTLQRELEYVASKNLTVRFHVAGDWARDSLHLDHAYMAAVWTAFKNASPRPVCFGYTHMWRALGARGLHFLRSCGLQVFASVHNEQEGREAAAMGYRLAIDRGLTVRAARSLPSWTTWAGTAALACPEQRLGAEKITCSTCMYCYRTTRTEAVIFDRH